MGRGGRGFAEDQDSGGVTIKSMDQLGSIDPLPPGAEQPVDVVQRLRATLHRKA